MRITTHAYRCSHPYLSPGHRSGSSRFFEANPAFRLLYESPKARLASAETLLEVMDRDDIDRAVVFGFPWNHADTARRHNDYVLEAAARYPQRPDPPGLHESAGKECCAGSGTLSSSGRPRAGRTGRLRGSAMVPGARGLSGSDRLLPVLEGRAARSRQRTRGPLVSRVRPHWDWISTMKWRAVRQGIPLILAHWGGGLGFYELAQKGGARRPGSSLLRHGGLALSVPAGDLWRDGADCGCGKDSIRQRLSPAGTRALYLREITAAGLER